MLLARLLSGGTSTIQSDITLLTPGVWIPKKQRIVKSIDFCLAQSYTGFMASTFPVTEPDRLVLQYVAALLQLHGLYCSIREDEGQNKLLGFLVA